MKIVSAFTDRGEPKTGLTPTIRIRDIGTGLLVVTDVVMTELDDGFYYYNFTTYDADKDYAIRTDGTDILHDVERYQNTVNDNYINDIAKACGDGNIQRIMHPATTIQAVRKVGIGRLDYVVLKVKKNSDTNWDSPLDEQTLYAWYYNLGEQNPYKLDTDDGS